MSVVKRTPLLVMEENTLTKTALMDHDDEGFQVAQMNLLTSIDERFNSGVHGSLKILRILLALFD